jgi:hypothetical protein
LTFSKVRKLSAEPNPFKIRSIIFKKSYFSRANFEYQMRIEAVRAAHPQVPRTPSRTITVPEVSKKALILRSNSWQEVVHQKGEATFVPSRELLGDKAILTSESKTKMIEIGMDLNSNYQGDITDFDIENFKCPPKLNCALRLENISADATDKEIFDVFYEGKIFSFSKKDPVPGRFTNCAGILVFMTRAATEAFLQRAQTVGVSIRGEYMKVIWNRDKCCPAKESEYHQSRVIQIAGPQDEFDALGVEEMLHTKLKFELVDSGEWLVEGGRRVVELQFASILGQSRVAVRYLNEYLSRNNMVDRFEIWYAPDPCDRVPLDASSTSWSWSSC